MGDDSVQTHGVVTGKEHSKLLAQLVDMGKRLALLERRVALLGSLPDELLDMSIDEADEYLRKQDEGSKR